MFIHVYRVGDALFRASLQARVTLFVAGNDGIGPSRLSAESTTVASNETTRFDRKICVG